MEDPVQSEVCKHVFSRAGIEHLFKKKNTIVCPKQGCNQNLKRKHFKSSKELTDIWQEEQKRRKRQVQLGQK